MRALAHQNDRRNTHILSVYFAENLHLFNLQAADGVFDGFIYSMLIETNISTIHPAFGAQVFSDPSTPDDYRDPSSQFQELIDLPPEQLEDILLGREQAATDATFNTLAEIQQDDHTHSTVRTRMVQDEIRKFIEEQFMVIENLLMAVIPLDPERTPDW